MGMQSRLGEKPGEETLETEEGEGSWNWELGSKTGNGRWEERWGPDELLVEGMLGEDIRCRYSL